MTDCPWMGDPPASRGTAVKLHGLAHHHHRRRGIHPDRGHLGLGGSGVTRGEGNGQGQGSAEGHAARAGPATRAARTRAEGEVRDMRVTGGKG
jgi:hypothetical protein